MLIVQILAVCAINSYYVKYLLKPMILEFAKFHFPR